MRFLSRLTVITVLLTLAGSCILPYEVEQVAFDRVIVVDGKLTTENKKHNILLSYTTPIAANEQSFLQGAQVWVENSNGSAYLYSEVSPGKYVSNDEFAASDDYDYQLFFRTANGRLYQSSKTRPIPAPPIDSIYDRYAEIIPANSTIQDAGIQFFLDSHDPSGKAKHFRYEWEETYKIVTPYTSLYEWDYILDELVSRQVPVNVCYASNYSSSLIIGSTLGSIDNRIAELPLQFVSGSNDILRFRYSILARQYSLTPETYNFYKQVKDSERQGTLFDEQQGSIVGNITSFDDPREVVLGNFEVSGVSTLRVFFNFTDLDDELIFPDFRFRCDPEDLFNSSTANAEAFLTQNSHNIVGVLPAEFGPPTLILATSLCSDCTTYGSNVVPDFWLE